MPLSARSWRLWFWWLTAVLILFNGSLAPVVGTETDIWWHLAAGQRFWQHGLELTDPFSFTQANQPWTRIDWLFQALLYPVYQFGGVTALILVRSACLLGGAAVTAFMLRRRASFAEIWLLIMLTSSIWCSSVSLRPATASFFLTALWVAILERGREGRLRALWFLPPLMIFWFNLHVAALAGILLLGLYAVGHALESFRAGQKPRMEWFLVLVLSGLATLVNPQTWQTVYYPVHFLLVKTPWRDIILEVQAPGWEWPGTWKARLLLGLALIGSLQCVRRGQFTPLLVTLVCGYLMNHTYRHQFQLCSALVPWAALSLPRPLRVITAVAAGLLALQSLIALLFLQWPVSGLVRHESFSETLVALASQGKPGLRVFTDMNAGGYFLWNFGGRQKVFIDSRADQLYLDPEFLADYFEIWLGGSRALALLDRYGVQVVTNNRLTSNGSALFPKLLKSGSWVCLYSDMIGEFYCRKELAEQFPAATAPDFLRNFLQGYEFLHRGRFEDAERSWQGSIQDYPQFASAHQALARLWIQQGKRGQARQALARAEFYHAQSPGLDEDWGRAGVTWPAWLRGYFLPFWAL